MKHQRSESCGLRPLTPQFLRATIGPLKDNRPLKDPLRHWNLRNLTLQIFLSNTRDFGCLHSTFARLYNAAALPASRLCLAGLIGNYWQGGGGGMKAGRFWSELVCMHKICPKYWYYVFTLVLSIVLDRCDITCLLKFLLVCFINLQLLDGKC